MNFLPEAAYGPGHNFKDADPRRCSPTIDSDDKDVTYV